MSEKKVTVTQRPESEVPVEVLADSIKSIADGVKRLRSGRLNDKALVLLIQHAAPGVGRHGLQRLSMKEIKAVLDAMESLEAEYLRKKPTS